MLTSGTTDENWMTRKQHVIWLHKRSKARLERKHANIKVINLNVQLQKIKYQLAVLSQSYKIVYKTIFKHELPRKAEGPEYLHLVVSSSEGQTLVGKTAVL